MVEAAFDGDLEEVKSWLEKVGKSIAIIFIADTYVCMGDGEMCAPVVLGLLY